MSSPLTAVAMSGGLDSSVAAWLLSRERPVVGLSMLLWDRSDEAAHGRCCGALDLGDARRVAAQCGIRHYTVRMEEEFERQVVDPFVRDYLEGRTPVPCTRCNTWIKFDLLLERARSYGAAKLATGHYARVVEGDGELELHAAAYTEKDQSYYLWELGQEQLARSEFPLGELSKPEVRRLAGEAGLVTAGKGESMELCFVAGGVQEFVEERAAARPERFPVVALGQGAEVVDSGGRTLGRGAPAYRYTVGQRRGLGITSRQPLYVLGVEPESNRVVVGERSALASAGLEGDGLRWVGAAPKRDVEATVRIRSRHPGVAARIRPTGDGGARVEFAEPQLGVAPGQAAVFYAGSRVLGGCWIRRGLPAAAGG